MIIWLDDFHGNWKEILWLILKRKFMEATYVLCSTELFLQYSTTVYRHKEVRF